jgi:hypothetical protein
LLPIHTLVGVILTQSADLAIGIVAVTLSSDMGRAGGGSAGAAALAPLHRAPATNDRPTAQPTISRSLENTLTGFSY